MEGTRMEGEHDGFGEVLIPHEGPGDGDAEVAGFGDEDQRDAQIRR